MMQNDIKLDHFPFIGPYFINKKTAIERLLHKNHKNGSIPKVFNKNTDTSRSAPPKSTIARHQPKINSVRFEDLYDQINPMDNTSGDT